MSDRDLSPAAEAFLGDLAHWLPKDVLEEARGRLAGLLEGVRGEERQRFEAWIVGPPYERDTSRYSGSDEQTAWPGQYVDLAVQLAWEAWQKACRAEAAPRWTACADGLPAEGVPVLACHERRQAVATWDGWHWRSGGTRCSRAWFSHWRPLPAGPEEGKKC